MKEKLKINQSLIKALYDDPCPASIKAIYIDKTAQITPSLSMNSGSYFEYLALGVNSGKQSNVTDLPRLKSGEMSVAQQRIIKQSEVFKKICEERPIKIIEKQVEITVDYNEDYSLNGTLDFIGTIDSNPETAIFDLKLTSSLYREHTYGPHGSWSWEFPYNADFIQAYMYNYLYSEISQQNAPFYYLVFDYKPEAEYKIIRKKVERMHIMELMESIRKTIERIEFYKSTGWEYNANYKNCMNCPLKNECPERVLQKPVTTI